MKKRRQRPAALLLLLVLGSALAMTVLGLALKYSVGRENPQIRDTMAIIVPFVLLRGDVTVNLPDGAEDPEPIPKDADEPEVPATDQIEAGLPNLLPIDPVPEEIPNDGAPLFAPVEESYFDTALFIGDSRTVGLANYARLGKADYFCDVGMSVFKVFDKAVADQNFEKQTLGTLLQSKQYTTIYLMLGINEIGYPAASLKKALGEVVEQITALQPNAILILQANLAVSQNKAQTNETFSLDKIKALNEMIASYADNKQIFYLDVNPYFADENGYFRGDATGDGVHPYAAEYKNWSLWIKDHAFHQKQ